MAWVQCSAQSWPQVLREEQWLLLPRILSQVCRGMGWLPTLGVECIGEQHRRAGGTGHSVGPSRHLFFLRQGLQRPSLGAESEEDPGSRGGGRGVGQRECPTLS